MAATHGVSCDDAAIIAAGSNVLVHLKPAPVVARVMTGTAVLHDDVPAWLGREVAVGAFAAERGGPVVPPSDLLLPGPYEHDGFWMTFWQFVPHDRSDRLPDALEVGRSLRELHAVLADYPGELETLAGMGDDIGYQLAELLPCPWLTAHDIDRLRTELERLTPAVFEASLPAQPLHGDASLSNLLRTEGRLLWNDLEDVCAGPVGWDIAGVLTSAAARVPGDRYVDAMLRSYGGPDLEQLDAFIAAHHLYAAVWQAFDAQRRPIGRDTAPTQLARWLKPTAG